MTRILRQATRHSLPEGRGWKGTRLIIHNAAQKAGDSSWSVVAVMLRSLLFTYTIDLINRLNERMGLDHTALSAIKITEQ